MGSLVKIIFSLVFIAFVLMIGPWLFIWAINTLVAEAGVTTFFIPFTFWTWLAAVVLNGFSITSWLRKS